MDDLLQVNAIVGAAAAVTAGPALVALRTWSATKSERRDKPEFATVEAAVQLPDDAALLLGDSGSDGLSDVDASAESAARLIAWAERGKALRKQQDELYVRSLSNAGRNESATFWASLVAGLVCMGFIIFGVELAFSGKAQLAAVSGVASLLPAAFGKLLFSQSKSAAQAAAAARKSLTANAERAERISGLIGIAALVGDEAKRQRLIVLAALLQAFPQAKLQDMEAMADRMTG
ncbi:TRADD-N-associated membrane domain-containing protein [Catenulispora rubra]|uniref:TRADD-N-associated membrane domain-containing protein n=1 Tax=Catenulispora rubra TaxID=280293 RepID=UPI0018923613|nr:hypothetical protein [Catenulispora rubra]